MVNGIDAFERRRDSVAIANVSDHQLDIFVEICRPDRIGPVDLLAKIIKNPDLVTSDEKLIREVRADETGTAGDQDSSFQTFPLYAKPRRAIF